MTIAAAPRNPYGPAPLRRPGSIRRTSSIDVSWPDGDRGPMCLQGHARDLVTPSDGSPPRFGAEDRIEVAATPIREILALSACPPRPALAGLVGRRAGSHFRAAIDEILPEERDCASPLYLLLDDLAGTSLVAAWAWSLWRDDWLDRLREDGRHKTGGRGGRMEGVCIGFAPGSSALAANGFLQPKQNGVAVPPLEHPEDPEGWHPLPAQTGVGMRRARRIDAWVDGGTIYIDAGFQDSATAPGGRRVAIHEYALSATADFGAGVLLTLSADPRVLPHSECPGAIANIGRLVGTSLAGLRKTVLEELRGTAGCTHLNDALRALAEVPQLIARLPAR